MLRWPWWRLPRSEPAHWPWPRRRRQAPGGWRSPGPSAYTKPATKTGPLITDLRTLGINGEGAAALRAVKGYDDATGVGSPDYYVQSFS